MRASLCVTADDRDFVVTKTSRPLDGTLRERRASDRLASGGVGDRLGARFDNRNGVFGQVANVTERSSFEFLCSCSSRVSQDSEPQNNGLQPMLRLLFSACALSLFTACVPPMAPDADAGDSASSSPSDVAAPGIDAGDAASSRPPLPVDDVISFEAECCVPRPGSTSSCIGLSSGACQSQGEGGACLWLCGSGS